MLRPPHCVPGPGTCTSFESGSDPRIHGSAGLSDQLAFVCKSTPFEKPLILAASSTKAKLFIDVRVSGWVSPSLARPQEGRGGMERETKHVRVHVHVIVHARTYHNFKPSDTERLQAPKTPVSKFQASTGLMRCKNISIHLCYHISTFVYMCIYIYMYMYC